MCVESKLMRDCSRVDEDDDLQAKFQRRWKQIETRILKFKGESESNREFLGLCAERLGHAKGRLKQCA